MQNSIRQRLVANDELCASLAKFPTDYGDVPAIFYQKAPADTDSPENFYPRIIFTVDKFSDAVHGVAGVLTVDIFTLQNANPPEPIERLVRETLENVFFKPLIGEIFSLRWQKTDVFEEPTAERFPLLIGAEMVFEIYEWATAETSTPDPIASINCWAHLWDENLIIIGATEFENFIVPTRENPVIYFNTSRVKLTEQKSAVILFDVEILCHVFAPTVVARREWLAAIQRAISHAGRVTMDDRSPMHLHNADLNFASTEIQGQLTLDFKFGVNRELRYAHPISKTNWNHDSKIRWQEPLRHGR